MKANDIYYINEEQYYDINKKHFEEFLNMFIENIGMNPKNLQFFYMTYGVDQTNPIDKFNFMRHMVLFDDHFIKYQKEFFRLLSESDYKLENEMIYYLKMNSKADFAYYLEFANRHPLIDAVDFKENVDIYSDQLGDYSYLPLKAYLLGNREAMQLITQYITESYCHQMSWRLMDHLEKCELITSLLGNYFEGTYYHSYLRKGWDIIDPASGIVMNVRKYNELFNPEEIIHVTNDTKETELELAKIVVGDGFAEAPTIAIAKQIRGK